MNMERREIVRRAIEFRAPPRLPFWQNVKRGGAIAGKWIANEPDGSLVTGNLTIGDASGPSRAKRIWGKSSTTR